jgi:hypothetical protein
LGGFLQAAARSLGVASVFGRRAQADAAFLTQGCETMLAPAGSSRRCRSTPGANQRDKAETTKAKARLGLRGCQAS